MTSNDQLDHLTALAAAATPGPWHLTDSSAIVAPLTADTIADVWEPTAGSRNGEFIEAAREALPALVDEVRRLRAREAALTTLAERWQQMADHGDVTIGSFDGPAAATLDAEVGERGRVYRKAAADVRDVLATGRVPHDLMTDDELDAAPAARSAAV